MRKEGTKKVKEKHQGEKRKTERKKEELVIQTQHNKERKDNDKDKGRVEKVKVGSEQCAVTE